MKDKIIGDILSSVQYHKLLTDYLKSSNSLHSISKFTPIDWIMTNVCDYTRTLLETVNNPKITKTVNRVTITDISSLEKKIKHFLFNDKEISNHFKNYLIDDEIHRRVGKINRYFDKKVKEILGEALLIFSLIHTHNDVSILIDNDKSSKYFGDYLNNCDELLIYDSLVLKIKMIENDQYRVEDIINEPENVEHYLREWQSNVKDCRTNRAGKTLDEFQKKYNFKISDFDGYHSIYKQYLSVSKISVDKTREP